MKHAFSAGIAGLGLILLTPKTCLAQGTMFFSNLATPTASSVAVGADSWLAQFFLTGGGSSGISFGFNPIADERRCGDPGRIFDFDL